MIALDWLPLALVVLAVYRVAYMVAVETGPFALSERLRGLVYHRFGKDSWVFEGIGCPLCVSFWLALPFAVVLRPALDLWLFVLWLGIAGAVLTVHLAVTKN